VQTIILILRLVYVIKNATKDMRALALFAGRSANLRKQIMVPSAMSRLKWLIGTIAGQAKYLRIAERAKK